MSQTTPNKTLKSGKRLYHSPKFDKLGKVSELTLTSTTFVGSDGGSGIFQYAS